MKEKRSHTHSPHSRKKGSDREHQSAYDASRKIRKESSSRHKRSRSRSSASPSRRRDHIRPSESSRTDFNSSRKDRKRKSDGKSRHRVSRSRSIGQKLEESDLKRKKRKEDTETTETGGSVNTAGCDRKTSAVAFSIKGLAPKAIKISTLEQVEVDDEKERKRERLRIWRERQMKENEEEEAVAESIAENSVEEMTKEVDDSKLLVNDSNEHSQTVESDKQAPEEDEIDPLDAYMAGIVEKAAVQESFVPPASNVISFEDLQSLPNEPTETAQADIPQLEADADREKQEEIQLQEFMSALKKKREREDEIITDPALFDPIDDATSSSTRSKEVTGRIYQGLEEDIIGEEADHVDHRSALEILQEAQKRKEIKPIDHSQIEYVPFSKNLYVSPREINELSEETVEDIRSELEIKVRGRNCPRPIEKWSQCGFSLRLQQLIKKKGYDEPFAIQCQALPAIMSGRDVIGIAKTGSGKTLAFLLPMFRHILHQPLLKDNEGPIAIIMAPARELAQQIYTEARRFAKDLGLRATAVYGGSPVSEQIANLKRGSDIVICTPGRMIDILCLSAGKMVSLNRVTYVVLDEADRMFDMGFEPQITKIMMNIRPDRQTLLFSATFPRSVESLARKVLKKPIEITVGARSTASGDIVQYVEVREESDKFMRLLQLLGHWYGKGNVLVFVNTQQSCDQIFQDLMKAGYPALSLHGGKDQMDRDYTIDDFKRQVRTLMVATSVAGRGLDVKDLVLVINYHCPNHLEDYVHRVGRTGRAGRKGTAYTFISPDEEEYAVDLVKAFEKQNQPVPQQLIFLAEAFKAKVKRGEARYHGSGFKGKGFTFDESERNETQRTADIQKRQYEIDQGIFVEDEYEEEEEENDSKHCKSNAAQEAISAVKKAQQIAQILDMQYKMSQSDVSDTAQGHFVEELEINEYPQQARWKVTQKEASDSVAELTGAAIIARGSYVPSGRKPNPGERKLYLAIEGPTRQSVLEAKRELQRVLDETTLQVGLSGERYSKYNL